MTRRTNYVVAFILILVGVLFPSVVMGQSSPNILISPTETTVAPTETFTVSVDFELDFRLVQSVEVGLTFDPTYLQVVSITEIEQDLGNPIFSFDNGAGTISYESPFLANVVLTDFTLFEIEFQAGNQGTAGTSIAFDESLTQITAPAGDPIVGYFDGTVIIQVADNTPPELTLIGADPLTVEGNRNASYVDPGATATDDVDGDVTGNIVIDSSAVNLGAVGSYTVNFSVQDTAGNETTATRTVNVVDTTPPQITVFGLNPITLEANSGGTYTDGGASATDSVDNNPVLVTDTSNVNVAVEGTYTVTYTATDASGNEATSTRTVIVQDTTPPVITLIGSDPLTVEGDINGTYSDPGATATDNVDGNVTGSIIINDTAVNLGVVGSYTVNFSVLDAAGNEATATRTVNVVDTTPPVINLQGDNPLELFVGDPFPQQNVSAFDNVDGDISGSIGVDTGLLDTNTPGTYDVTYSVTDAQGNIGTLILVVNVNALVDITPPVITLLGANPLNLNVGDNYNEPGATAFDNVDGDLTNQISIDASAVNVNVEGSYQVLYSVFDQAGNEGTNVRIINVSSVPDITPPGIILLGDNPLQVQAQLGGTYVDPGAVAFDDIDGEVTSDIVIDSSAVNLGVLGTYFVQFSVFDQAGNEGTATRQVDVIDTIPPVIALLGNNPLGWTLGTPYVDPGATAQDNLSGDVTGSVVIDASAVDVNTPGTYFVQFLVNDGVGNIGFATRTVIIGPDTIPPVITLLGDNPLQVEAQLGGTYVDPGATAQDNLDGDVSGSILIDSSTVNLEALGTYFVQFSVFDQAGNEGTATRQVDVIDTIPPVITVLGDNPLSWTFGNAYVDPGATAQDNLSGDLTGSVLIDASTVDVNTAGEYDVQFAVSDGVGNTGFATRTVIVENDVIKDTTPPVITLLGANPLELNVGDSYVEPGATALDETDGDLTSEIVIDSTAVDTSAVGSYDVIYKVSDTAGNEAQAIRTVNVSQPAFAMVTRLVLIDGETDTDVFELQDGAVYDLSDDSLNLPHLFNIRAEVDNPVGSVVFSGFYDKTENLEPYAIFGDYDGDYGGLRLNPGVYNVVATPFSEPQGNGEAGKALSLTFIVTEGEPDNLPPVAVAGMTLP